MSIVTIDTKNLLLIYSISVTIDNYSIGTIDNYSI